MDDRSHRFQQALDILRTVLPLDRDARKLHLDEACADDPDLRSEVEELLAGEDRVPDILGTGGAALGLENGSSSPRRVLATGHRLGPYEIDEMIGSGGMSEVYRGRDTRLDRTVAIKLLSAELTSSEEHRGRFEREAKILSGLAHPNICTLHDIGSEDGLDFLVMEHIVGDSLASRIEQSALSIEETVQVGGEIAAALEVAHRAGIVHRDLKPANVMLTATGVKLLDFGIAKPGVRSLYSLEPDGKEPDPVQTLTQRAMLIGTMPYMSPEQLEGRPVDARSDIFALGAVLYEMITGERAFPGTGASLIGAIMASDPADLSVVAPKSPEPLRNLVRACLQRDPNDRIQTAHDVMLQLSWTLDPGSATVRPKPAPAPRRGSRTRLGWAAGLVAACVGGFWLGSNDSSPSREGPSHPVQFEISLPSGTRSFRLPRVSPDGVSIAFVAEDSLGESCVWIRPLETATAYPVLETRGVESFTWAPDGRQLAFIDRRAIKALDLGNSEVRVVCAIPEGMDFGFVPEPIWTNEDRIIFDLSMTEPLYGVSAAGGMAEPFTKLDTTANEVGHVRPTWDRGQLLYVTRFDGSQRSLTSKKPAAAPVQLGFVGTGAWIGPGGALLYGRSGTLYEHAADRDRTAFLGDPTPIAESVIERTFRGRDFSAHESGVIVYRRDDSVGEALTWFDRAGRIVDVTGNPGTYVFPSISPDGRRLAVAERDEHGNRDVWVYDLQTDERHRLTYDPGNDNAPVWSPDGTKIAYLTTKPGNSHILLRSVRGLSEPETLLVSEDHLLPHDWSSDGERLVFTEFRYDDGSFLYALPLDGSGPVRVRSSDVGDTAAQLSPDGRWIATTSDYSGGPAVYVFRFDDESRIQQISPEMGRSARWRRDGLELFYLTGSEYVMSVPVTPGDPPQFGRPEPLFRAPRGAVSFEVSPEGERFLFLAEPRSRATAPMTVLLR